MALRLPTMCLHSQFLPTLLLLGLSCLHYTTTHHLLRECHPSYYHWPRCVDHPDGYGCDCGPGFVWNSYMCVALGLDSRLEFTDTSPARYALLLNKPFPDLPSFTVAFWIQVTNTSRNGTILSYSQGTKTDLIWVGSGPTLSLVVHGQRVVTDIILSKTQWAQVTWTWTSQDNSWQLFVNGQIMSRGRFPEDIQFIPGGGELVLGQAARLREDGLFDLQKAFQGQLAHVNIWHVAFDQSSVQKVYHDCLMQTCGDAIEWADFRSGTRGQMLLRWPANITGPMETIPCLSEEDVGTTCDRYCSHVIGVQCNADIIENIFWERTKAEQNATVPCPGQLDKGMNATEFAYRECALMSDNDGVWMPPLLDECISQQELQLKHEVIEFVNQEEVNESVILHMLAALQNHTADVRYTNPIDLATAIDSLGRMAKAQEGALGWLRPGRGTRTFGLDRDKDKLLYPSFSQTTQFAQSMFSSLAHVVADGNDPGWRATMPAGVEADQLMLVLDHTMEILAHSLRFHVHRADVFADVAQIQMENAIMDVKVKMVRTLPPISTDVFPPVVEPQVDVGDLPMPNLDQARITLPASTMFNLNITTLPEYIPITMARFFLSKVLPNHDIKMKSKEDNVNSELLQFLMFSEELQDLDNLSHPIIVHLPYLNNFNVSNPECVTLVHGTRSSSWHWSRDGCKLHKNTSTYAECKCYKPGTYAITTDMYDVNWDRGDRPIILMAIPSYIGCSVSAVLCLFSCLLLIYLRTASKTAAVHKNFALAIVGSQVSFMVGINRFEHEMLCHGFAVVIHYFFVSAFSWLMNEAFNLYIVITYAAHSHGEHTEGGSQWRYYILGWILPGVIVGAFVGTHSDDYYADDMCWVAWKYAWLLLGPVIGIISVVVLVLVFTAKEQYESSYSKNEKTNKMLTIHANALWTQIILLTLCWSFAVLSIRMRGIIVKVLYALFNCLQGAFFLVFYFLLNEEVRGLYQARAQRLKLQKQGYEYSSTMGSDEEDVECPTADTIELKECEVAAAEPSTSSSSRPKLRREGRRPQKRKTGIEASSGEDSDCEMMITSI